MTLKPVLSIKTLYRSPVRTSLTFFLLGVVTFAFFSQVAEYAVTAREFTNAAKQYCGVGSAEVAPPEEMDPGLPFYIYADPRTSKSIFDDETEESLVALRYQPLTQAQTNAISALPYITSTDTRYMTAGTSDTYLRLDDGKYFYNYTARCVIEGTLTGINYGLQQEYANYLIINNCTLLAGNPPWEVGQRYIRIGALSVIFNYIGGGGTVGRASQTYTPFYKNDTDYIKNNMITGNRYVFVLRFEPLDFIHEAYSLGDLSDSWCEAIWPVDGTTEDYLETEKYAPLKELVNIANSDLHTFDMVYLDDMSAIMRFSKGEMAIVDGRELVRADSADKANVCVVSFEFAKANNLKVGDSITMKLGTELYEQYKSLGAIAATPERFNPPEKSATLKIVGIYADTDGPSKQAREPNWSYSVNTIFVPKSLLPVPADKLSDHQFTPAEFSFKVGNAWDFPAFLEEAETKLKEMGLTLAFYDDGWTDIAKGFRAAKQLSLIKIAVMSAAVAAATGFVVYLFVGRKKKEYAVMRALGTTQQISAWALLLPLMAVTTAAVLAGSAVAWIYTMKAISHSNALALLKEYAVSTSIPPWAAIGCIAGQIILTLFFARVLLRRIGAMAPLVLLQDNGSNSKKRKNKSTAETIPAKAESPFEPLITAPAYSATSIETAAVSIEPAPTGQRNRSKGFVLRYIWKHMRRSAVKSALATLLAALLLIGIGQLTLMKGSYARLCTDTVIKANFVGGLTLETIPEIIDSGYIKNPYYEFRTYADINFSTNDLAVTNNIARYAGEEAAVTYADGYDASCMDQLGNIIIAGKGAMDIYGLKLGDTVQIVPGRYIEKMQPMYAALYRAMHPSEVFTDEEILPLIQDDLAKAVKRVVRMYIVAGVVSTPSGRYDDTVFMPGTLDLSLNLQAAIKLDVAEFTLSDNFRADEFRAFGEETASESIVEGVAFIMDTSKLENLKNTLRLLETLYPIAVAAALLIGGFLCCLVIVQSSKEAAIMRVLGTTKGRTRAMLTLEQLLLSMAGIIIGGGGLLVYKGPALAEISGQIGLFVVLYFAVILISAVFCSALATRRNVLELLQTKE